MVGIVKYYSSRHKMFLPFYPFVYKQDIAMTFDMPHCLNHKDCKWRPPIEEKKSPKEDIFEIVLELKHFTITEIKVRAMGLSKIIVEACHADSDGKFGTTTRNFKQECNLPSEYDINNISCTLSSDGYLSITVPKNQLLEGCTERFIPIVPVGRTYNVQTQSTNTENTSSEIISNNNENNET